MKILFVLLAIVGLAACNNPQPAAPSTKRVDSVVAAAADTIKAISVDSVKR